MKRQTLFWVIGLVSVVGLALAVESTIAHYAPVAHEFCNINETFDCAAVNRGAYSDFLGIPVALFGVAGYVFFLVAIVAYANKAREWLMTLMGTSAIVGLAFTLYLTYLEAFVIHAWCVICLGSAACMTIIFASVMYLRKKETTPKPVTAEDMHQ